MNKPDFPTEEQGQVIQLLAKCERLEARVAELEDDLRWALAYVDALAEGKPSDAHDDDARWARIRSI